jgi:hypothetical protein
MEFISEHASRTLIQSVWDAFTEYFYFFSQDFPRSCMLRVSVHGIWNDCNFCRKISHYYYYYFYVFFLSFNLINVTFNDARNWKLFKLRWDCRWDVRCMLEHTHTRRMFLKAITHVCDIITLAQAWKASAK